MGSFLRKLQESDDTAKRKFLIISSLVIMLVIVYVWLMYFNNIVASVSDTSTDVAENVPTESHSTILSTMKRGSAVVYQNIWGSIQWVAGALQSPKEYIIKPLE
ncbi:MAG: hypothetical protein NUV53_04390 [Patescibacteria group bacterium]|nr:hypothetical protein [Patescibacteria group bacterium]